MKCPKCQTDNLSDSKFCRSCATPLTGLKNDPVISTKTIEMPPEISLSGTMFAERFQVVEELGRGGMGVVYRAFDNRLREEVALKIIKPEIASDKKALERFSTELKLARKINHRNICRMYELMEHQGVRFISMEYVPGEDLRSFIKRARRLDIGAAVAIGIQVGEGLAEAHRQGVVHRDLKPGNIMIDREGNAKIMDFGIARSPAEKGITGEGRMIGTPEYISPEQIDGAAADAQSDLYALGVILFEMVCGTYPFEGDTAHIIAQKIHGKKPPDPKAVNPHVPDALAKAVLKCLEKDRGKRYKTADEVLADLHRIEDDLPTTERVTVKARSSVFAGLTRGLQKRKALGAILVLAAVAIIVVLALRPKRAAPPIEPTAPSKPVLAVLFFDNRTNDPSLEVWRRDLSTKFIVSIQQLSSGLRVRSRGNTYTYLSKLGLEDKSEYSADDLAKIARISGATYILTGQLMKVGENLQIYYDLVEGVTGTTASSGWKEGKQAELDTIVAELARKLLGDLRISAPGSVKSIGSKSALANDLYAAARDLELKARLSGDPAKQNLLFSQVFEKYQDAIKADPQFAAAFWGLGDYFQNRYVESYNLEDHNLMKENYETAHKLNPLLAGANVGLGWAGFFGQKPDDARKYFLAAVELNPDDPEINMNVGSFLYSIGQIDSGIRFFTRAIESGEDSVNPLSSYYRRTRAYIDIGKLAEARKDVLTMIERDRQDASLQLLYARILAKMDKREEAERALAQASILDPAAPDIPFIRTYLHSAAGDREQALPILEKAAKENALRFCYFLAENYAQLGMADEALAIIQEGIKSGFSKVFTYLFPYQVLRSGAYDKLRGDRLFKLILEGQKTKNDADFTRYRELRESMPGR
jgi:serine/threonine protein kinase/tetratricopeptide (TPR) repeat protein